MSNLSALYSLEEHWTDLVSNAASLNERIRNQQDAIWELIETEVHYIRTLKVIQDVSETGRLFVIGEKFRNRALARLPFSPVTQIRKKEGFFCTFRIIA